MVDTTTQGAARIGAPDDGLNRYGVGRLIDVAAPKLLENMRLPAEAGAAVDPKEWLGIAEQVWKEWDGMSPAERASMVINQITTRARMQSEIGLGHAVLMSIKRGDAEWPEGTRAWNICPPEYLIGHAALVWEHVKRSSEGYPDEHQPLIERWAADQGEESQAIGFNIVIRFPASTKVARASDEHMAEAAISQLPKRALLEALVGRVHASVFSFKEGDRRYVDGTPGGERDLQAGDATYRYGCLKPEMLTGAAAEVWHYCQEQGLHPTLEAWDGSQGSGYTIEIHWCVNKPGEEPASGKHV